MALRKEKCMYHQMGHGWKMFVLGLLVLANTYWTVMGWDYFIGGALALGGLWKLIMPAEYC